MARKTARKGASPKKFADRKSPLSRHTEPHNHPGKNTSSQPQVRHGIAFHLIIFLTAFLIIFSRRPDAVLHAQFWAEDGKIWYHDAYQFGIRSLLMPQDGYLQTLSRLIALLTLLFPLQFAPLVMNLLAMAVQILPVNVFLSSRFSNPGLATRAAAAFLYLALPSSYEIDANVTNIQWHLGLLACMLLLARPASTWGWRIFEGAVFVLVSLDSVMGALLVPVALILWWRRGYSWREISFVALLPGAAIQTVSLLFSQSRRRGPLGASLARVVTILGRQMFLASLVGMKTVTRFVLAYSADALFFVEVIVFAAGVVILFYALLYSPIELTLFILFALSVLTLCLVWPTVARADQVQWDFLMFPGNGNRYFFLPMLAFLASVAWIAADRGASRGMRYFGVCLLFLVPIGIVQDWRYPPYKDLHFQKYAAQFERAPSGTEFVIPINPKWSMQLTKR